MKLKVNKEFLVRHLFAFAVFLALGGWFGYDAFVRYPATPARALYASIERSEAPEGMSDAALESFKAQKTSTQRLFATLTLLAAAAVGLHLLAMVGFKFTFDEDGFVHSGRRLKWSDVESVDESKWESKRVLAVSGKGWRVVLDAWHHEGVKAFYEKLKAVRGGGEVKDNEQ